MIDNLAPSPLGAEDFVAPASVDNSESKSAKKPARVYDLEKGLWLEQTPPNETIAANPDDFFDLDQRPLSLEKLSPDLAVRQKQLEQRLLVDVASDKPDQVRNTLISYELNGGDIVALAENNPDTPAIAEAAKEFKDSRANAALYVDAMRDVYQEIDTNNPAHLEVLEQNVRQYTVFSRKTTELLPEDLRTELQKTKPEVVEAFDQIQLKLIKEQQLQDIHKQYELIETFLSDPQTDPKVRAAATVMATEILTVNAKQLAEIGFQDTSGDPEFTLLREKLTKWGVEDSVLTEKAEKIEAGAAAYAKRETLPEGFDVLSLLNLRDKEGKIIKGKAKTFAAIAALFVLSDKFFASVSGGQAFLPVLFSTVSRLGNEVSQDQRMTELKINNPAAYAYYQRMGYGSNFLTQWLTDFLKDKAQNYIAAKAAN